MRPREKGNVKAGQNMILRNDFATNKDISLNVWTLFVQFVLTETRISFEIL